MRLEYFVVSQDVIVDQQTNNPTLINVIDEIATSAFPLLLPALVCTTCWIPEGAEDAGKDFQVAITISRPSEDDKTFRTNFTAPPGAGKQRLFNRFVAFEIREPGLVRFSVSMNERSVTAHEILVQRSQ